jgi:ATP-dependent Clp protease ATP-binding subunit ClpB
MTIRPEFLNRIDDIIMFKPLTRDEIKGVVRLQFGQLQDMLMKSGITVSISEKAVDWIALKGYDPQYGARPVKRIMQRTLLNELSKLILSGTVSPEKPVMIDQEKEALVFRNN